MKLATPQAWYGRDPPGRAARALLAPASWVWTAATARRIARTQPVEVGAPVICVGNLTVGGSGKTPVARALLQRLRAAGVEAHALSRGYGGRLAGPHRVDPARDDAAAVGDEPLLLARDAPAWIARDRPAGARAAVGAGAEAVVMDDGHQNPSLAKALSLVVVDGDTREGRWPFGAGGVVPAGPLREPLRAGLARADAAIVLLPEGEDAPDPELLALLRDLPVLLAVLEAAAPPPRGPQLGFAGVAKPWRVESSLRAAGCDLVDFAPFPDHAPYREVDLRWLLRRAEALGAGLVTTEKDHVRLPPAWRARVAAWPVRTRMLDEAALDALLATALGRPLAVPLAAAAPAP